MINGHTGELGDKTSVFYKIFILTKLWIKELQLWWQAVRLPRSDNDTESDANSENFGALNMES